LFQEKFLPRDAYMHSADYAVARCPSVCHIQLSKIFFCCTNSQRVEQFTGPCSRYQFS